MTMKHIFQKILFISIMALFALSAVPVEIAAGISSFPGAKGYGAQTPGGRGGKVFQVTTLADYHPEYDKPIPGSFRAAAEAHGPRIVVFRIGGVIDLKYIINITQPCITIAGQTAPGEGICFRNYGIRVKTHDVIIRYVRIRPGDINPADDALWVYASQNVVIDHVSTGWANDETLSVTVNDPEPARCHNITVQWSIISECLNYDGHAFASGLDSKDGGISFHHNIFAHNKTRNPRIASSPDYYVNLDFRNNVLYNWGNSPCGYSGGPAEGQININYVGNFLKPGPSTTENYRRTAFEPGGKHVKIYAVDNFIAEYLQAVVENRLMFDESKGVTWLSKPVMCPEVTTDDVFAAYSKVLLSAGATLPIRDEVDLRIIKDITLGTGKLINSQKEVGSWPEYRSAQPPADTDKDGMPDYWGTRYGLDNKNNRDGNYDNDKDGYTNIEEYLNVTNPLKKQK